MTLDVGLVLEVDTVLVAEIVPVWSIRIVSVTYMVDVTLKHEHYLLLHLLTCKRMASLKAVLMTVHTLHLDGLAVEVVVTSSQAELILGCLCIADLHLAETKVCRSCLHSITLLIEQRYHQCITVRLLGAPLCRVSHRHLKLQCLCIAGKQLIKSGNNRCTLNLHVLVAVESVLVELYLYLILLCLLCSKVTNVNLNVCYSILVLRIKVGTYTDITQLHWVCRCQ